MVSNVENLNPQVMRYIGRELQSLMREPLEGIRLDVCNEKDLTEIQAVLDGPADTPYFGGRFRVKLNIGKEFPAVPPKAHFLTKIFHPNVSPSNGEICVNTLKRDWKSDLGIKHILLCVKCLLIVPNPESALNEEAGKLLLERYDDYCSRARLYTEIHAQVEPKQTSRAGEAGSSEAAASTSSDAGPSSSSSSSSSEVPKKVAAVDKKALSKKEKSIKDKKKTLKRL